MVVFEEASKRAVEKNHDYVARHSNDADVLTKQRVETRLKFSDKLFPQSGMEQLTPYLVDFQSGQLVFYYYKPQSLQPKTTLKELFRLPGSSIQRLTFTHQTKTTVGMLFVSNDSQQKLRFL